MDKLDGQGSFICLLCNLLIYVGVLRAMMEITYVLYGYIS